MASSNEQRFFGFWPADAHYGEPEKLTVINSGVLSPASKEELLKPLLNYQGHGWRIVVTGDYLCMLSLDNQEARIQEERAKNSERAKDHWFLHFDASSDAPFEYCEALNALYFLIFAACFSGRGDYFLHDFTFLNKWSIDRFVCEEDGRARRVQLFARKSEQAMRRLQLSKLGKHRNMQKINHEIFADAAAFWKIIFDLDLISTTAVGAQVLAAHRLRDFRSSLALTWFEVEEWLFEHAKDVGVETKFFNSKKKKWQEKNAHNLINSFKSGTWVYAMKDRMHNIRGIRNKVAHGGYKPTQQQSAEALRLFVELLNYRSGLFLNIDTNPPPTHGLR